MDHLFKITLQIKKLNAFLSFWKNFNNYYV